MAAPTTQSSASLASVCPPSIALVINLAATPQPTDATVRSLGSVLQSNGLTATWVVADAPQAKALASQQLASAGHKLAVAVTARSPQRLRTELANLQTSVQAVSGQDIDVVLGDPQQLRSRAALLADLGITAIVSDSSGSETAKAPRQLPCGLWQLDASLALPQVRRRWALLPARRPSLQKLLADTSAGNIKLAAIDLATAASRDLQSFESLLQDIQQQQVDVASVSELVAQLSKQHAVKPQRSILRRVA